MNKIFDRYVRTLLDDPERKPLARIVKEAIHFGLVKRSLPSAYFTRLLYKKGRRNYLDYTDNKSVGLLQKRFNDASFVPVLQNKYLYHLFFTRHGLPVPNTLAYNVKKVFFLDTERVVVESVEGFRSLLERAFRGCRHNDTLFLKEVAGAWGKGAHRVPKERLDDKEYLERLFEEIVSADFIIQEAIVQHEAVSALYPHSINSIRIDTFTDQEGNVEILSALLRMGGHGNIVDNVTAGGLFVGVDLQSGRLRPEASVFLKNGAATHLKHPDTGVAFRDYPLPFFEEVKTLAIAAAEKLPAIRLVGWDVVLSEEGPVLLEGNHLYHIGMSEMAYGGYLKNPVFRKVLEEAGMDHTIKKGTRR